MRSSECTHGFVPLAQAKRALEIGMFTGYGAAAILEALPSDGECVSLDIDPYLDEWVSEVGEPDIWRQPPPIDSECWI